MMRAGLTTAVAIAAALAALEPPAAAQGFHRRRPAVDAPASKATAEKVFPFDETFVLRSINGKPIDGRDPPTFTLDRTLRARGFSGCNSFSMAYYPVKNQQLASGAIASTRKTCAPDAMAAERAFLVALHSLPKWDATPDGDLVIKAPGATLQFRRGL